MRLHIGDNFASLMYRIMYGTYAPQTKQTVHFLHIGKTGGTAIKHILKRHSVTRGYVIRRHGHRTTLREVSAGEKVIFFVRDPLSRFISGFYSRLRQGQPRYFNPWTPEERMAFERFDTPNRLAVGLFSENEEKRRGAQKK